MQELRFQFTDAFMSIGFFEVSIDPGFVRFQHGHKSFKKMGKLLLQAIINRKQNQLKPLSEKLYQLDFFLEMMKTECDHLRQNVDESTGEDRKTWIRLYVREKRYLNLYCKAMETQFGSDCSQFKEETDGHIVTNTPSHRTPPQSTGSKRTAVQAELATQSWPPPRAKQRAILNYQLSNRCWIAP